MRSLIRNYPIRGLICGLGNLPTRQVIRSTSRFIPQECVSDCIQSRRTFVSLNDLAKLTPFGQSSNDGNKSGNSEFSSPNNNQNLDGYTETVILPFPVEHLFSIVSDVAAYEEFVPYCVQSRILSKEESKRFVEPLELVDDDKEGTKKFLAELKVGFGNLQEQYTSKVTILPKQGKVIAEAIPTPIFQHLSTSWTLTKLSNNSSKVHFQVHYAFSNPLYAMMAKAAMHKMSSQMIGAFERRAVEQS